MVFVHYLDLDLRESIANAISRYLLSMQSAFWAIDKKAIENAKKRTQKRNETKSKRNSNENSRETSLEDTWESKGKV